MIYFYIEALFIKRKSIRVSMIIGAEVYLLFLGAFLIFLHLRLFQNASEF